MSSQDDKSSADRSADQLKQTLLTDDGKWWEFLDPETYEVKDNLPTPTRSSSDLIDWSKKRETQRRSTLGFGYFNRCDKCGQPSPPDFSFCPRCGGTPHGPGPGQLWSVIITEFESETSKVAAAEIIAESGHELGVNEVHAMLEQTPAVFNMYERKGRVHALVQKLAEIGVYSKSFPVSDPSIPWIRETAESVTRDTKMLAAFSAAIAIALGLGVFVSGWFYFIGLATVAAMGWKRFQWYKERYQIDPNAALDRINGFDGGLADETRSLLRDIRDEEMREYLSICVMEYYTLHQQFRKHEEVYGDVLLRSRHALHDLFEQILNACRRYADLTFHMDGVEPAQLRARIGELRSQRAGQDPRAAKLIDDEIDHLKKEGRQYNKMKELAAKFKERMRALTGSIEALRLRMQSLKTAEAARAEDVSTEEILAELDDELQVFEKTFHSLEVRR